MSRAHSPLAPVPQSSKAIHGPLAAARARGRATRAQGVAGLPAAAGRCRSHSGLERMDVPTSDSESTEEVMIHHSTRRLSLRRL